MVDIGSLNPVTITLLATTFTWLSVALGASTVFLVRKMNRKILDGSLGFAAGVMISVSFWSLLIPGIAMSHNNGLPAWFPVTLVSFWVVLFYGLLTKSSHICTQDVLLTRLKVSRQHGSVTDFWFLLSPCIIFPKVLLLVLRLEQHFQTSVQQPWPVQLH